MILYDLFKPGFRILPWNQCIFTQLEGEPHKLLFTRYGCYRISFNALFDISAIHGQLIRIDD